jgi:hypothetical protein
MSNMLDADMNKCHFALSGESATRTYASQDYAHLLGYTKDHQCDIPRPIPTLTMFTSLNGPIKERNPLALKGARRADDSFCPNCWSSCLTTESIPVVVRPDAIFDGDIRSGLKITAENWRSTFGYDVDSKDSEAILGVSCRLKDIVIKLANESNKPRFNGNRRNVSVKRVRRT